jgi:hypothetical protein
LPDWSVRVEYLRPQFIDVAHNFTLNSVLPAVRTPFAITWRSHSNIDINPFRIGLSYLFE